MKIVKWLALAVVGLLSLLALWLNSLALLALDLLHNPYALALTAGIDLILLGGIYLLLRFSRGTIPICAARTWPRKIWRAKYKILLSGGLIWLFFFGPLAPWQVIRYPSRAPDQVQPGSFYISYEACSRALDEELAKKETVQTDNGDEGDLTFTYDSGYCGKGCFLALGGNADNLDCWQTWGAREK